VVQLLTVFIMRECLRTRAGETGKLLAFAFVILACAVPMSADTLAASQAVVPDRLFNTSLAAAASDFPSSGTELVLHAEENGDGLAFAAVPYTADTLDLLGNGQDNRSESGGEGVRRFILLAILFGGALRFLTSPVFYDWAADVFDPLDGY
jgi:hypothetical protein